MFSWLELLRRKVAEKLGGPLVDPLSSALEKRAKKVFKMTEDGEFTMKVLIHLKEEGIYVPASVAVKVTEEKQQFHVMSVRVGGKNDPHQMESSRWDERRKIAARYHVAKLPIPMIPAPSAPRATRPWYRNKNVEVEGGIMIVLLLAAAIVWVAVWSAAQ